MLPYDWEGEAGAQRKAARAPSEPGSSAQVKGLDHGPFPGPNEVTRF